ncbi:MAG: VOC family protein [Flavobacteriales bacterium]
MILSVHPKLPMRDKAITRAYYEHGLGFRMAAEYDDYLIVQHDAIELHFFLFRELDPKANDGQVYFRTDAIDELYRAFQARGVAIHPNGALADKPWGQREFALLDSDHNLLTFGQRC